MKPGDLVKRRDDLYRPHEVGLFVGLRTFTNGKGGSSYTCAEVMWFNNAAPNGDRVSTIQTNLIEVVQVCETDESETSSGESKSLTSCAAS